MRNTYLEASSSGIGYCLKWHEWMPQYLLIDQAVESWRWLTHWLQLWILKLIQTETPWRMLGILQTKRLASFLALYSFHIVQRGEGILEAYLCVCMKICKFEVFISASAKTLRCAITSSLCNEEPNNRPPCYIWHKWFLEIIHWWWMGVSIAVHIVLQSVYCSVVGRERVVFYSWRLFLVLILICTYVHVSVFMFLKL